MILRLTIFALLVSLCACNSVESQSNNSLPESNQTVIKTEPKVLTEPLEFISNQVPENIKSVWANFIKNGQYRLAQPADMTFSEKAKLQLPGKGESPIKPYEYIWGDLEFDKRIEDDHLAAIVVDTTKNEANKFGLVFFSPIKETKDKYEINWLYRDKDLSKATVSRASGEFYVSEYSDDGSRKSCSVKWNKKAKKFECPIR